MSGRFDRDNMLILSNSQGEIISVNRKFEERLGFKLRSIRGQHIGILMTPVSEMLHRNVFLRHFASSSPLERDTIALRLSAKTHGKRPLIVFDCVRRPLLVAIHLVPIDAAEFRLLRETYFSANDCVTTADSPETGAQHWFLAELTEQVDNAEFIFSDSVELRERIERNLNCDFERNPGVIIINIDLVGSTQMLSDHGVPAIIHCCKSFFNDIATLVKNEFYPYITVHEIVGDGFVLILNASWMYNLPMVSATLAVNFAAKLLAATRSYVNARIGISLGDIQYGFIGNKLRIFGEAMNESARLQDAATTGSIMVNNAMHDKLLCELEAFGSEGSIDHLAAHCTAKTLNLKGLGEKVCHHIQPPLTLRSSPSSPAFQSPGGTLFHTAPPTAPDFLRFKR